MVQAIDLEISATAKGQIRFEMLTGGGYSDYFVCDIDTAAKAAELLADAIRSAKQDVIRNLPKPR